MTNTPSTTPSMTNTHSVNNTQHDKHTLSTTPSMMNTHSVNNTMHDEHTLSTHSKNSKIKLFNARLFPRLQIGCFSCSLAELFLAPHTHLLCPWNLGQYQRWSVLSTSQLPSHFPLGWIATCVVLFTHTGGLQESGA